MNKIAVVAVCDFMKLPNGGEVFLLNNMLSAMESDTGIYELVGMTFDKGDTVGKWKNVLIGNKEYRFLPVSKVTKDKEKTIIPFRLRMVYGLFKYRKRIRQEGFSHVYVHSAELSIPFWNNSGKSKLIYHVHGDPSQTLRYSRFPLFRFKFFTNGYLSIINKTIQRSNRVIWAANRSKKQYEEIVSQELVQLIDEKSVTIHSSFDRKLNVNEKSIPRMSRRNHLVTVSRLAKIKHVDFIIECIKELVDKNYDVDLIICGDGEEEIGLRKLAENLGISERIVFLGLCSREQIATCLDRAEGFLFASESEAMSLVVLESLYTGTPVVSTDVGDISDVIKNEKTGYIVKSYNMNDYVKSIEKVLMKGKSYYSDECKRIVEKYTPEFMACSVDREINDVK